MRSLGVVEYTAPSGYHIALGPVPPPEIPQEDLPKDEPAKMTLKRLREISRGGQ